jgi:hypothetical protein
MVWSPIQLGDDIQAWRAHDQQRLHEIADGLSTRITQLDQLVATRDEENRQAATMAMRWGVRGLLITLVGAGLSIFG